MTTTGERGETNREKVLEILGILPEELEHATPGDVGEVEALIRALDEKDASCKRGLTMADQECIETMRKQDAELSKLKADLAQSEARARDIEKAARFANHVLCHDARRNLSWRGHLGKAAIALKFALHPEYKKSFTNLLSTENGRGAE